MCLVSGGAAVASAWGAMSTAAQVATVATVASSAYGLYAQRKNAKAQQNFYNKSRKAQDEQIFQSTSKKMDDRARKARAERSRLRALSAESGLTGISLDTAINDVDFQAGRDMASQRLNMGNQMTDSRFSNQSNLNMISQPDYVGSALNTGLSIYRSGSSGGWWGAPDGST